MRRLVLVIAVVLVGCTSAGARAPLPDAWLTPVTGSPKAVQLGEILASARFTAVVFFSAHCPCQRAHDARLVSLSRRYAASGVKIVLVDSEVNATRAIDAQEAERRGYPFPLYLDPGARLARTAGAEVATSSLLLDARGNVLYRGGIDSDRTTPSPDAIPYLADAIDAALAGRAAPAREHPAPGCSLRTD